jgi:hypothetical protein
VPALELSEIGFAEFFFGACAAIGNVIRADKATIADVRRRKE